MLAPAPALLCALLCGACSPAPAARSARASRPPGAAPRAHRARAAHARANCGRRSTCATRATSPTRSASAARCPATAKRDDQMYMSFRLSTCNRTTGHWADARQRGASSCSWTSAPAPRAAGRARASADARRRAAGVHAARRRRLPVAARAAGCSARRRGRRRRATRASPGADPAGYSAATLRHRLNRRGSLVMIPSTPMPSSLAIIRGVVHRPHVELAAALGDRPHERARDHPPVRHDRVEAALGERRAGAARQRRAVAGEHRERGDRGEHVGGVVAAHARHRPAEAQLGLGRADRDPARRGTCR